MNNIFYVYAYLREDNTPYYIGKGKHNRAYDTTHQIKIPNDKSRIVFYQSGLFEEDAFNLEIKYIKLFGRKDIGTGILRNLTNGGEGLGGFIFSEVHKQKLSESKLGKNNPNFGKNITEETKQKISDSLKGRPAHNKGKPMSEETKNKISVKVTKENNPNFGKNMSTEQKNKISASLTGNKHSEETKQKMSSSHKGRICSEETRRKIGEANSKIRKEKTRISVLEGNK